MYTVSKNTKLISYALMLIGFIAVVHGFITDAHRSWPSLMVNNYFFLAISAFAIFFIRFNMFLRLLGLFLSSE